MLPHKCDVIRLDLRIVHLMLTQLRLGYKMVDDTPLSSQADTLLRRHMTKSQCDVNLTEVCAICQCRILQKHFFVAHVCRPFGFY